MSLCVLNYYLFVFIGLDFETLVIIPDWKNMSTTSLSQMNDLKYISNRSKCCVFGYVRQIQSLLSSALHHNIPSEVINICCFFVTT